MSPGSPGFFHGFRPKRSQHQALDALAFGIGKRRINWVLGATFNPFSTRSAVTWPDPVVEHRIGDERIIRLIAKWLTAGVLEDGRVIEPEGRHRVRSSARSWRTSTFIKSMINGSTSGSDATGDVIVVRYADDSIDGFEHRR